MAALVARADAAGDAGCVDAGDAAFWPGLQTLAGDAEEHLRQGRERYSGRTGGARTASVATTREKKDDIIW
jgi:hypothetical protein